MKCNHDNPPPYPNWIWSCSKCGQQFTNNLNTGEESMNIEEQVDNFIKENSQSGMFDVLNAGYDGDKRLKAFIQSLLDQQRQEIIEELEGIYYKPEAPEELKIDSHQVFFNQALELAISKIKEL